MRIKRIMNVNTCISVDMPLIIICSFIFVVVAGMDACVSLSVIVCICL